MSNHLKTSDSQRRAAKKYLAKFADIKIRVDPEWREDIQMHCESVGESMSAFIKRAITETMARDQSRNENK